LRARVSCCRLRQDVLIAKAKRLEIRQLQTEQQSTTTFPLILSVPINGRLVAMEPFTVQNQTYVFLLTERFSYAVISYDNRRSRSDASNKSISPHPIITHATGSLQGGQQDLDSAATHNWTCLGRPTETGPLVAIDPASRCIALHLYDGIVTIIPIHAHYNATTGSSAGAYKTVGDDEADYTSNRHRSSRSSILKEPFHCRIEERTVLALTFLPQQSTTAPPVLVLLHQDARGAQHLQSLLVAAQSLQAAGSPSAPALAPWLKKSAIDGGSSILIPVPPPQGATTASATAASSTAGASTPVTEDSGTGGVLILGQRQCTYCSTTVTKVVPLQPALILAYCCLPPAEEGNIRYLLADELGNWHVLTVMCVQHKVVALQLDTLGSCHLAGALEYLGNGLVFLGSPYGDSQLVQIHDEPVAVVADATLEADVAEAADRSTYLSVEEEYTNLGPILDFDLVPTAGSNSQSFQSQVVLASGSSKSGTLRLIRNGIGMNECAAVEIPGIQQLWNIRQSCHDAHDSYLVQSFVGETRVLGVAAPGDDDDDMPATLEELQLPGLDSSASSLFVGNVAAADCLVQITPAAIRLVSLATGLLLDEWHGSAISVATANEAGQIAIARGTTLAYFTVTNEGKLVSVAEKVMDKEVGCLNLCPWNTSQDDSPMDGSDQGPRRTSVLAVGLWHDSTVRLLSTEHALTELLHVTLEDEDEGDDDDEEDDQDRPASRRNRNMMARSLCMISLETSSQTASGGSNGGGSTPARVDMLFVGLGDGTLISFAIATHADGISAHSRKEVCLGTQRIDLIPLSTQSGGACILATGDRPTVVYLAGLGATSSNQGNPKLCYSTVNLEMNSDVGDDASPSQQSLSVNVAAPFFSPTLFSAAAVDRQHYTLCVADDSNLRLGVIDDIQKLHVTTCYLGMSPRRVVHCPEPRLFAVACIESGINHLGAGGEESNMGNCLRFLDDAGFDDIERIDMEPFEMILSVAYVSLAVPNIHETFGSDSILESSGSGQSGPIKQFLVVGTAYALPDEDMPTRGRILVFAFSGNDGNSNSHNKRSVRQVTEFPVHGGVYSICQFYDGTCLCTLNSKTMILQMVDDLGSLQLQFVGAGHHGHILSLFVKSRAQRQSAEARTNTMAGMDNEPKSIAAPPERLAIVGDLMRSVSLMQHFEQHAALEEIARDFHTNWTTAVEMLNDDVYIGAENWHNLFCLRRNKSVNEEVRCRLETIGEFHLGEMVNKFMLGSLVMPVAAATGVVESGVVRATPQKRKSTPLAGVPAEAGAASSPTRSRTRRPVVGSQALFGTVDGSLGVVLGLDHRTAAFLSALELAMVAVVQPVGGFGAAAFRAKQDDQRLYPSHGFVDGDLIESFLDLDRVAMGVVVQEMNRQGKWQPAGRAKSSVGEDEGGTADRRDVTVDDVVAMVEEMTMLH
jgi:DNA damage-binding protein 1